MVNCIFSGKLKAYTEIPTSVKLWIAELNSDIAKSQWFALKVQSQEHSLIPAKVGFKNLC